MKDTRTYLSGIREIQNFNVWFLDINVQAYVIQVEFFVPAAYVSSFNSIKQQLNLFVLQKIESLQLKIAGSNKEVIMR